MHRAHALGSLAVQVSSNMGNGQNVELDKGYGFWEHEKMRYALKAPLDS
jgi:hypothetical protein